MKYLSEKDIGKHIVIDSVLDFKKTARYATKYYGHDQDGTSYMIVNPNLPVQKYYVKRALKGENLFASSGIAEILINQVHLYNESEDGLYAVYKLVEDCSVSKDWNPDKILLQFYQDRAVSMKVDESLVDNIITNLLDTWPDDIHSQIRALPDFQLFKNALKEYSSLDLILEHGDFTPNNVIMTKDSSFLLLDYEFVKQMQPIGFDMYDWHMSRDKNFEKVPYPELNAIKYQLITKANQILDRIHQPQIDIADREFIKENEFIYNRYDIFYGNDFTLYRVREQGSCIYIPFHREGRHGEIGVWQTPMSEWAFNILINTIFHNHSIVDLKVRYSQNQYKSCLTMTNHLYISLPEPNTDILDRMKKKARYNLNRSRLHLSEAVGGLQFKVYTSDHVPEAIIQNYFIWKQKTHGTEYHLEADKFIARYHISHVYVLETRDEQAIAILFTCEQCADVYLENLSYDSQYAKFSPGMILYVYTLQALIDKGKRSIFLGNGNQPYKMHFNSINTVAYSGKIYKIEVIKVIGNLFSYLHKYILEKKHEKAYENDNRSE